MNRFVGRRLGPYLLQGLLGAGGMGAVFRGYHTVLGQARAIKVLPPQLALEDAAIERFRREANIAAGLRHPNIVLIHDVGETDDGFSAGGIIGLIAGNGVLHIAAAHVRVSAP
jgi:serine/threonine-protein kinase